MPLLNQQDPPHCGLLGFSLLQVSQEGTVPFPSPTLFPQLLSEQVSSSGILCLFSPIHSKLKSQDLGYNVCGYQSGVRECDSSSLCPWGPLRTPFEGKPSLAVWASPGIACLTRVILASISRPGMTEWMGVLAAWDRKTGKRTWSVWQTDPSEQVPGWVGCSSLTPAAGQKLCYPQPLRPPSSSAQSHFLPASLPSGPLVCPRWGTREG